MAKSDAAALKEVAKAKGWLKEATYAVVKIEMTVVKEWPEKSPVGRTLRSNIHG